MHKIITAALWCAGLILAGSDGPYFPFINAVGLALFYVASSRMVRECR